MEANDRKPAKIYLGSDHAGFKLKEQLAEMLLERGYNVVSKRAYEIEPTDDYPELIKAAVLPLQKERDSVAIVLGGSGQGEAMAANRFRGIRAAVYYGGDTDILMLSKEHNNANVLALGARFLTLEEAEKAVLLWLRTPFTEEDRHERRIVALDRL